MQITNSGNPPQDGRPFQYHRPTFKRMNPARRAYAKRVPYALKDLAASWDAAVQLDHLLARWGSLPADVVAKVRDQVGSVQEALEAVQADAAALLAAGIGGKLARTLSELVADLDAMRLALHSAFGERPGGGDADGA
jgi:hypothetical protein